MSSQDLRFSQAPSRLITRSRALFCATRSHWCECRCACKHAHTSSFCICSRTCQSLGHVLLIMGMLTSLLPRWWVNYPRARVSFQGAAHKYVCVDVLFISHIYWMWHGILRYITRCVPHTPWLRVIPLMMREQMQTACVWKRHLDYKLINKRPNKRRRWGTFGEICVRNKRWITPEALSCWTKTEKVL